MRGVYIKYPNDLEAACFYSLSLLGVARNADNKLRLQVEAGAIALDVFQQNPNHPCASHYAIHAFDSPDLARLALPSAQRYAKIAPSSHHAQHMPAHIFVQLGMWPEAAKSNENGWATSKKWVEREKLPKSKRDYHSLQWLHYVYLQQGLIDKAEAIFKIQQKDMREGIQAAAKSKPNPNLRSGKYYYRMLAAAIIETEQWEKAKQLIPPEGWEPKSFSKAGYDFVRGYAAAMQGDDEAKKYATELKAIREKGFRENYFSRPENLEVWELEIETAIKLYHKDYEAAIQLAKQATLVEEKLPSPSGPPRILKPTYELLGEVYLKAGKPKKAKEQFTISLMRHPNRIRSLIGAARSAKLDGDKIIAKENYEKLLSLLKNADSTFPELKETKEFLKNL
jgi:tetratricopeptide (TPR) repeat protein